MLKQILAVFIFLLFFVAANAQLNTAVYHYRQGLQHIKNNKAPEAIASFNKAIALNKKFDSAYVELAHIYNNTGNTAGSIGLYKKALTINPLNIDALTSLGEIYKNVTQDVDSALYYYTAAVKIDDKDKKTFTNLAWLYNTKKDFDNGIAYAVKALEIDNNHKPAYGELGHAFRSTKRYADAIEQFKKNLAVSEVDVAYLYSGYCYIELNNKDGAMQQYESLKKINEKMAGALKRKIDTMQ